MCQAQTSNKEKETPKERTERIKKEKATKDSLNVVLRNNKKQVTKETPKERTERIKKEKATKDSISTASYQQEIERLKKENAEKEKLVADLQTQADAKADVENKLANAEKTNLNLLSVADEKADLEKQVESLKGRIAADSANKALLGMKIQEMQIEADKNAKVEAPAVIVNAPVKTETDTAKKSISVPIKKKTYIQKKGTLVIDNNTKTVSVRKSDIETFKDQIASLKSRGFKEKDVNK